MRHTILLFLILFTISLQAQLKDCSECDTITYAPADIAKNTLYDLQLLRNEIFARHQYVFKDARLLEYFQEYLWYQPDHNNPAKVTLNSIENANITLFKNGEGRIKKKRQRLFNELGELKRVLKQKDTITINLFLDGALSDGVTTIGAMKELHAIFSKIDLKDVNWYKDKAIYKVSTDNGFLVRKAELHINGNEVIISAGDIKHSEIMTDPFKFGSNYYSEDEYQSVWIFKFDGQKLRLDQHIIAG
ncbi:YARHG domain-containing protein [Aquimarina sp. 2201CG14-23]|uniref:YARHG domain-containing protein n=1 Tax=Aquimarina mycalae TaxID=3040073 RepID=UPI002477F1AE|nr:YARHG domain-containing protein [Aquimarina sp. 2201CG14-23]MDH7445630.1 YARHG domain-containing protein [Aquimarina sp. 2201CG14-23]